MILLELISAFILEFFVKCLFGELAGLKALCGWLAFLYILAIISFFSTLFSGKPNGMVCIWFITDTIFYAILGYLAWDCISEDKREARKALMRKLYFSKN